MKKEDKKWRVSNCKKSYMVAHNTLVDLHNIVIDEIFDEHEAQLKSKDDLIFGLEKEVSLQGWKETAQILAKSNDEKIHNIKAKDEEISLLKYKIKQIEAQEAKSCEWKECDTEYDTSWGGSCGAKWTIEHGTPQENHMNFCPQCGGKIIHIYPKDTK